MKKVFICIMALLLAFGSFACAAAPAPATEETTQAPVQTEEPAAAPREAELNVMMSFPQYMDQWETYCKQFEAKVLAEQNIKLTINLEMPSSDQYESVLQARLTSDDAPDLYTVHCNNLKVYNEAGNITDLSGQPFVSTLYENVRDTVMVDGKVLAVPIESMAWGVLYNKAIFADCGLTAPKTLDDLKNIVTVLESKGYTPFMLAFQEQWVPQLMTALTLGGKVSGELTDWVDRMYQDAGSYEEVREIFDVIDLIMQHGTDRAMEEGSQAGAADFANGKAAIFVQGTWAASTIMETNPDFQLGVFALPINNDENCTRVNLSTSTTLAVHPSGKEMDLALGFANYVLDDQDSSALFQSCTFNPIATCHTYEAASWVSDASAYVANGHAYQDLVLPSAVTEEQGKLLQELYVGSVTVDQFIARMDEVFKQANALD